jgi:hypothetical protein
VGLLSAARLRRLRLWVRSRDRHRILLQRLGRLGLARLGLGLGPELVWPFGVRQRRLLPTPWFPRSVLGWRVYRQSTVAPRPGPPVGSLVPERSACRQVSVCLAGFPEHDGKIGKLQFRPIGRHGKLEPVWIRDGVNVRKPIGHAGRSRRDIAERGAHNRGTVAKLPWCATRTGSGTALLGSGAAVFGSDTTRPFCAAYVGDEHRRAYLRRRWRLI